MRLSCILCCAYLIVLGICGGIYAFTRFDLLLFLCMGSTLAVRIFLGIAGIAALFMVYALAVLRPFRGLK
jgi:uncharacterized membrane protein YuzA (DUF378 family)